MRQQLEEKLDVVFDIKKLPYESIEFKDIVKKKIDQLKNKKIKHNLDQNFIEIFEDLIKNKNENYYLASLKIENKIISSCFGILLNNKFYYYIPSMDTNAYDYYKPGKILVLKIINWCIERKIKIFDFGLGDEKYKENFSNNSISLHRYTKNKSLMGKLLLFVMKIVFFNKKI